MNKENNVRFPLVLTREESEVIGLAARSAGKSKGDFIRDCIYFWARKHKQDSIYAEKYIRAKHIENPKPWSGK
jgi:uncharacterized protein (DUF1778 family)